MYNIYIDESGDEGIYHEHSPSDIGGSSRFFTLGGIIIDERDNYLFKKEVDSIISDFFNGTTLAQDFELHYFDLRQGRPPFDLLKREDRLAIADRVFNVIKSRDCKLVSITIDLLKHYTKYSSPYNPRSYALFLIQERFQYFLEDENEKGHAIYEGYVSRVQKGVEAGTCLSNSTPIPVSPNLPISKILLVKRETEILYWNLFYSWRIFSRIFLGLSVHLEEVKYAGGMKLSINTIILITHLR